MVCDMAVDTLGVAAQHSFALEAVRQTIQQEQMTASAITQAQQGPNQSVRAELESSPSATGASGSRGTILDILA